MKKPPIRRSSRWPSVRNSHLARHPTCAACGDRKNVVVHHKVPVHVDASLELEPANFISLCEGATMNCHLWIGHLGSWGSYNPTIERDAKKILDKIRRRP